MKHSVKQILSAPDPAYITVAQSLETLGVVGVMAALALVWINPWLMALIVPGMGLLVCALMLREHYAHLLAPKEKQKSSVEELRERIASRLIVMSRERIDRFADFPLQEEIWASLVSRDSQPVPGTEFLKAIRPETSATELERILRIIDEAA